jgi:hypothetical protein
MAAILPFSPGKEANETASEACAKGADLGAPAKPVKIARIAQRVCFITAVDTSAAL